jgi:alpha-tubulin suppressor-like RCC1 family protein
MLKQALIVLGILLAFGCADVPDENKQLASCGCSDCSDPVPENQYVTPKNDDSGSGGGSGDDGTSGGTTGSDSGSSSSSDTTAPTISSPPTSGATDVSVSENITVPFSEAMDSSTINSTNITVVNGSGSTVNGVWSYSGTTATFNPFSDLSFSTTYTVTVGTGVKDSAGNNLASASSWGFSTEAPYPISISTGYRNSCALIADGTIKCWGYNRHGELGDGTSTNRNVPVSVSGISNAIEISTSNNRSCALLSDNSAKCWGESLLGDGSSSGSTTPVSVYGPSYNYLSVSVGDGHGCLLLSSKRITCWGGNTEGELGDGTYKEKYSPTMSLVNGSTIYTASAISAGSQHTCALLDNNTLECWGKNNVGQLGPRYGSFNDVRSNYPVTVLGMNEVAQVSSGGGHTCALLLDGTIKCWGSNTLGELGDGTTTNSGIRPVSGISNSVMISSSLGSHSCAVLADKSIKCWGNNYDGQLGDGTTTVSPTPVTVSGISNAVAISAGYFHTCALLDDKSIKCWGGNSYGQLGDGTTTGSLTPITVQF